VSSAGVAAERTFDVYTNMRVLLALTAVAVSTIPSCRRVASAPAAPELPPYADPLPGMPPVVDPNNIYSETAARKMSPVVKDFPSRVYVPESGANAVEVIDPKTYRVIDRFRVGRQPQHVVPSWDLKTLWVLNDLGDSLTEIDPATGKKGKTIKVLDPYNMYYTPDGRYAIVVAERLQRLDFYNARTMTLEHSLPVACRGVDHIDFSANGRYFVASCEFSGELIKVDVPSRTVLGRLPLEPGGMPQDVKTSPDGRVMYVADMMANGVYLIDPERFVRVGFLPTGRGTHGLYPSRDARHLYVSNRGTHEHDTGATAKGSVSVIDFATRKVVKTWELPGHATPDMGGVSADGATLWLAGRYSREVYAINTADGTLRARIKVGKGPHGLCVYPQPGRYSLGHTGILR
jgi:YVTN family beta-propeller protein